MAERKCRTVLWKSRKRRKLSGAGQVHLLVSPSIFSKGSAATRGPRLVVGTPVPGQPSVLEPGSGWDCMLTARGVEGSLMATGPVSPQVERQRAGQPAQVGEDPWISARDWPLGLPGAGPSPASPDSMTMGDYTGRRLQFWMLHSVSPGSACL